MGVITKSGASNIDLNRIKRNGKEAGSSQYSFNKKLILSKEISESPAGPAGCWV